MASTTRSALVLDEEPSITVGGLTLIERAILLAHRAGFAPVRTWGVGTLDPLSETRLRSRGVSVAQLPPGSAPLEGISNEGVLVVGPNVLFGPEVLTAFASRIQRANDNVATAVREAGAPLLLYVPPDAIAALRAAVQALNADGAFADEATK